MVIDGLPLLAIGVFAGMGLLFGSFVTMASYRIPRGMDIVFRRSACPSCQHILSLYDLIPVFSWICRKGQCHHCQSTISIRYPVIEMVSALLFVMVYWQYGWQWHSLVLCALAVCLLIIVVVDLEHKIIPDSMQLSVLVVGIWYTWIWDKGLVFALYGGVGALLFALLLRYGFWLWKKKEGLGMGDVKFFAVAGVFLGLKAFVPFLLLAGVGGIITSFFWRKMGGDEEFPFGPSLALALWLCVLFPEYTVAVVYPLG